MPDGRTTTLSASSEQTEAVAADLAATLRLGDVVLLSGELGAGKTTFVRGAARALGVSGPVTSPTFTIGHIYTAEQKTGRAVRAVSHLDLYRLGAMATEDPDLLADYIGSDVVAFVEWPATGEHEIEALGRVAYRVRLEHGGGDNRTITIEAAS